VEDLPEIICQFTDLQELFAAEHGARKAKQFDLPGKIQAVFIWKILALLKKGFEFGRLLQLPFYDLPAGMDPQADGLVPGIGRSAMGGQKLPDLIEFQLGKCRFREVSDNSKQKASIVIYIAIRSPHLFVYYQRKRMKITMLSAILFSLFTTASCYSSNTQKPVMNDETIPAGTKTDTATFATGCFWCTEAIFQELKGVLKVTSGYSGGTVPNPSYEEVCSGTTGHAECLQVIYDPKKITYDELLEVFWESHDPTSLNRQGNDEGTQYRSAIFYHDAEQKEKAEQYKAKLNQSGAYNKPIVTEITPFSKFYPAENYHQDYYRLHGSQPYCSFVIRPKVEKFEKVFKDKLKTNDKLSTGK
jgi:peptide-methionine (S)-S-oxide reductase